MLLLTIILKTQKQTCTSLCKFLNSFEVEKVNLNRRALVTKTKFAFLIHESIESSRNNPLNGFYLRTRSADLLQKKQSFLEEKILARVEVHIEVVVIAFAFILEDFAELFIEYFWKGSNTVREIRSSPIKILITTLQLK